MNSPPTPRTPGAGGNCTLSVDDKQVASGHIPKTQPYVFSADEGVDVGEDAETAVSSDYKQNDNRFTGKIAKVTVAVQPSGLSAKDQQAVADADDAVAVAVE